MHLRRTFARLAQKDDRLSWRQHLALLRAFHQREREILSFPVFPETNGSVTAYVANFRRPQNIALIAHSLLASSSVSRVIVSNNNPSCDLSRWFSPQSDRITVLNHEEPQSCSMRHVHLCAFPSPSYLILDDDVFLLPSQIDRLCELLHDDTSAPHGLYGQSWEGDRFRGGIQNQERSIDVISRIYAFTAVQQAEFFRLCDDLGIHAGHPDWNLSRFDDVILSATGSAKPRMHDLGPLVDCPTQGAKDIATWRQSGFHDGRIEIYRRLCQIKPLSA